MPDAFISKVVRSGSCLEFISTACMRYRRDVLLSLFGPSGADQQEAQDGCQNGQLWLGVPL